MSAPVLTFLRLITLFLKNTAGCINSPYTTYRKLADGKTDSRQILFIFLLALCYFAFASAVRVGIRHPYLLTFKLNQLILGGVTGFAGMIAYLFIMGRLLGSVSRFTTLCLLWAYTLLPTIMWFFTTSFVYLILPPPRTLSIWGKLFSVVFIAYSLAILLWKLILYYLTLRFGLRIGLAKIGAVSMILAPIICIYSILMYQLRIFRIPFL